MHIAFHQWLVETVNKPADGRAKGPVVLGHLQCSAGGSCHQWGLWTSTPQNRKQIAAPHCSWCGLGRLLGCSLPGPMKGTPRIVEETTDIGMELMDSRYIDPLTVV
ncbi:hypothetical protein NDU88_000966 [Pleurodeles waltl]|uniref:Uncharacterized protein n=1 Tax=Pleurodeles waltl TaxID=8319 RepID=A0AAV7URG9_PLEWA|nr:hypothetical protein NDU88_000966 [Pleurodeles waltl]